MILSELIGVKRYHDHTLDQLIDAFTTQSGYKKLANGRMAITFLRPGKDEVLKVWAVDSAYERFIEIVKEWKGNKHMPRFLSPVREMTFFHKRTSAMPLKFKYVRMERLEEAEWFEFDGVRYRIDDITTKMVDTFNFGPSTLENDLKKYEASYAVTRTKKPMGEELKLWASTVWHVLYEMIRTHNAQDDLHERNVMKRSDGTAVITDPGVYGLESDMSDLINHLEGRASEIGDIDIVDKLDKRSMISGRAKASDYEAVADQLSSILGR